MKFMGLKTTGHAGLSLLFCVLVTACQPSDYYLSEEFMAGEDAYCTEVGKDLLSCEANADRCQPAYFAPEDETAEDAEPVFEMCVSNRHEDLPSDGGTTGTTAGGTTGSTNGGSTGGTDGGTTGSTTGGTTGSTGGGTTGGSTAGTHGGATGGTTGADPEPVPALPTVKEAYEANCTNVPDEHMWIKVSTETKKKGGKSKSSESVEKKVKICHFSGNGSSHTIVIACPALKAHSKHQGDKDYIGSCKL